MRFCFFLFLFFRKGLIGWGVDLLLVRFSACPCVRPSVHYPAHPVCRHLRFTDSIFPFGGKKMSNSSIVRKFNFWPTYKRKCQLFLSPCGRGYRYINELQSMSTYFTKTHEEIFDFAAKQSRNVKQYDQLVERIVSITSSLLLSSCCKNTPTSGNG